MKEMHYLRKPFDCNCQDFEFPNLIIGYFDVYQQRAFLATHYQKKRMTFWYVDRLPFNYYSPRKNYSCNGNVHRAHHFYK